MTVEWMLGAIALGLMLMFAWLEGWIYWPETQAWNLGPPQLDGAHTTRGVTLQRLAHGLFWFAFPRLPGSVHYLTKGRGPITGRTIIMRYLLIGAPGTRFVATEDGSPGRVTLYLSSPRPSFTKDDGGRWFSPVVERRLLEISPEPQELRASLDAEWTSADLYNTGMPRGRALFARLLGRKGRIGPVFGGDSGAGHGVHVTGEAQFELLALEVLP